MPNKKMSTFQLVFLIVFGVFILIGIGAFALYSGSLASQDIGKVVIWGTIDKKVFDKFLETMVEEDQKYSNVSYRYIEPENFDYKLAEAMSAGFGPDLVIVNQNQVIKHWFRLKTLPFESFVPKRDFLDTYIDISELFLSADGVKAVPLAADPLVMFYNKDIFAEKGIPLPPKYWDEVISDAEKIVERSEEGAIEKAAISLGTFNNIKHAKDIFTTMILQKNGKIVELDGEKFVSLLGASLRDSDSPVLSVLRFYVDFANPIKYYYTWNRALPEDQDMFAQDRLAMYIGLSSEYDEIKNKNPNLNFDMALVPQVRNKDAKTLTGGLVYGIAISNTTKNYYGAINTLMFLTSAQALEKFNNLYVTVEPIKSALTEQRDDALKEIQRRSAIMMRGWLDPDPTRTNQIFQAMVDGVLSGRVKFVEAIALADKEMKKLLNELTN